MEPQDLAATYRSKTDEELLELAEHSSQLTPQALAALTSELSGRKLPAPSVRNADAQIDPIMGPSGSKDIGGVAEFLKDVLNVYHRHFWAFIQLTVPAVILGYLAVTVARTQVRAIGSHLPHGVDVLSHRFELLVEIPVINGIGYFISWMGFCFSYAAVCSAVNQIENGLVPSIADCIAAAGKRLTVFFRLCIGLFLRLMITVSLGGLAEAFVFWALSREHLRLGPVAIWLLTYLFFFGCALVLSRLSLAIPSVVLDGYTVAKALFRSDELTEGKWTILAALLSKSLIGGYVAGILPFWIRFWIWPVVRMPAWLATVASFAAVTVVEPTMFIGFTLLYLRMVRARDEPATA